MEVSTPSTVDLLPTQCPYCLIIYYNVGSRNRHIKMFHADMPLELMKQEEKERKKQIPVLHPYKQQRFPCRSKGCSRDFSSLKYRKIHVAKAHPNDVEMNDDMDNLDREEKIEKTLTCEICGFRANSSSARIRHKRIQHEGMIFLPSDQIQQQQTVEPNQIIIEYDYNQEAERIPTPIQEIEEEQQPYYASILKFMPEPKELQTLALEEPKTTVIRDKVNFLDEVDGKFGKLNISRKQRHCSL